MAFHYVGYVGGPLDHLTNVIFVGPWPPPTYEIQAKYLYKTPGPTATSPNFASYYSQGVYHGQPLPEGDLDTRQVGRAWTDLMHVFSTLGPQQYRRSVAARARIRRATR